MADAADLKSVVRKDVRVRLPPSAPNRINNLRIASQLRLAIRFAYCLPTVCQIQIMTEEELKRRLSNIQDGWTERTPPKSVKMMFAKR